MDNEVDAMSTEQQMSEEEDGANNENEIIEQVNKNENDENTILLPEASSSSASNGIANPTDEQAIILTESDMLQCDTPVSDPMEEVNALDDEEQPVIPPKRRGRKPKNNAIAAIVANNDVLIEKPKSPIMRTPTQVPKKRRDAAMLAAVAVELELEEGTFEQDAGDEEEVEEEEEEQEDEEIDEEEGHDEEEVLEEDEEVEEAEEEEEDEVEEVLAEPPPKELEEEKPAPKRRGRKPGFRPSLLKKKIENDIEQLPTTSKQASKDDVVLEDQCRVCMATDDLLSLFKKVETQKTVADLLMSLCPAVSIARKDFMPQYICQPCLDNVQIACQLRQQCESTEKELRSRLSRSKNKIRRPTVGYIVVDAPDSDVPSEPNDEPDDNDFKISDGSPTPDDDDSEDFDFGRKPKRRAVTRGRRGRRKSSVGGGVGGGINISNIKSEFPNKIKKRMGRPPKYKTDDSINLRSDDDDDDEDDDIHDGSTNSGDNFSPPKKKRSIATKSPITNNKEYPCDECDQVFGKKTSLTLHKKVHIKSEPLNCDFCGKQFKQLASYKTHVARHEHDTQMKCSQCDKFFTTKTERRRHMVEVHDEPATAHVCDKCKRAFTTEQRLIKHKESRCPGFEMKQYAKKSDLDSMSLGRDLFKAVAPLTTTYWSDSFSD